MLAEIGSAVILVALAQHKDNNEIQTKNIIFLHAYLLKPLLG